VVTVPHGDTVRQDASTVAAAMRQVRRAQPRLRVVDYGATGDSRLITGDGRSTYAFVFTPRARGFGAPNYGAAAAQQLRRDLPAGFGVGLTGVAQLQNGGTSKSPGILAETLLGALGALAVLAFVFASLLALVPLAVAAVSILTTLLIVLGLSYIANISAIVQFLVALVGLGVAIDYSLLIVTRWREERARGRDNHDAVTIALATAGRAVLLSGLSGRRGARAATANSRPGNGVSHPVHRDTAGRVPGSDGDRHRVDRRRRAALPGACTPAWRAGRRAVRVDQHHDRYAATGSRRPVARS
jgi:putative drug exporter of the RND superfamily